VDVAHSLRIAAQHRYDVALAIEEGHDYWEGDDAPGAEAPGYMGMASEDDL
jgi:hypothetical protein